MTYSLSPSSSYRYCKNVSPSGSISLRMGDTAAGAYRGYAYAVRNVWYGN
jgi:hypothetical protein